MAMNSAVNYLYDTVTRKPGRPCIVSEHETISFGEFFSRAYGISRTLERERIFNQPILVYLPKTPEAVVAFAGILLSGNFYVPTDTRSPIERTRRILGNLGPPKVISQRLLSEDLARLSVPAESVLYIEDMPYHGPDRALDAMASECRRRTDRVIDTDPCYIMYTSGSTGIPKGVVVPHRGVVNYIEWAKRCLKIGPNEVIGNQSPLFFDNSTLDLYLGWSAGATVNLIPETLFMFPIKLIDYLEEHKITFIFFVPSVLVGVSQLNVLSPGRLPDLRKIVFAGEVMPTKHLAYWQKMLPGRFYVNLYGPTEITVDCTYFVVDRIYGPDETLPIGYPCLNSGILILDGQDRCAQVGQPGELCVRGSSLALGYWNDQENTRRAFVQNPLQKNYLDPIYKTGDIVSKNGQGQIIFIGRKDSQIKHMGYRIELGEIERAAESLPGVTKCCVLYHKETMEIVLFYEGGSELPAAELRRGLSSRIPSYMMPRRMVFCKELPLNANGKIDRKALSEAL